MSTRIWGKTIYCALLILWVFVALCVTARPAYAYVDPGSGLFFVQVIGSSFLGFIFLVRRRLAQLLGMQSKRQKAPETDVAAD
jgi:hypothetical protein